MSTEGRPSRTKDILNWLVRSQRCSDSPKYVADQSREYPTQQVEKPHMAEILKLDSPFRIIGEKETNRNVSVAENRSQKRRETLPENAFSDRAEDLRPLPTKTRSSREAGRYLPKDQKRHRDGSSSERASTELEHSDTPIKAYERRRRRKTKSDKYDLKTANPKTRQKGRHGGNLEGIQHSHRANPSAALLPNFSAKNIAAERLTVSRL